MSLFNRFKRASNSDKLYNKASDKFMEIRYFREGTIEYRKLLLDILDLCQKAIYLNDRAGDAHVLLANAFLLIHFDLSSEIENSLILKLGAAVIQHWSVEPMRQYPWTKNSEIGWKIYNGISSVIEVAESATPSHIKMLMAEYRNKHYKESLSTKALVFCTRVYDRMQ